MATNRSSAVSQRIGHNLRSARLRVGLTQEQVGRAAGLDRTEIGKLEKGARIPRADTLFRLAVALRLEHPGSLFDGLHWTPPPTGQEGRWEMDEGPPDEARG